jgi:Transposase DDE domain
LGYIKAPTATSKRSKKTLENLTQLTENEEHDCRQKIGLTGVFTRVRKLPFKILIVFILRSIKSSLQKELDSFSKEISQEDFNIRYVTKSAFSQARHKVDPIFFCKMNQSVVNDFYSFPDIQTWRGFRLLAVDGSTINLPKHKTTIAEFGVKKFGPKADSEQILARTSLLYDVLNLLTLDAQLGSFNLGERELLSRQLAHLKEGDLLLLDRGYAGWLLPFQLLANKIEFCVRLKSNWMLFVREFMSSNEDEKIVTLTLPQKHHKKLFEISGSEITTIQGRLVKVELQTGETEVLFTSLTDKMRYSKKTIGELYNLRWGIEEAYKMLKCRVEVECFSGKTSTVIKQDFFSKIFMMTLTASLAYPVEQKVRREFAMSQNKHVKTINKTHAVGQLQDSMIGIFLKNKLMEGLRNFSIMIYKTTEIVRPGRKNPRKHRTNKPPSQSYKGT